MKLLHGAVVATALALAAGDAQAAASCQALQKKDPNLVCRLGAYAPARFYRPGLKKPADVVTMLQKEKARVIALLQTAPLPRPVASAADAEALYGAMLAAAEAQPAALIRIGGPGGHSAEFPFMALRDWKTGKDRLKVPQGGATAIKWGGDPKGFEAFEVPFKWDGWDWKLYVPFACGNFWLEAEKVELVKPTVSVSSGDVCFGQPVPLSVKATGAEKIELTVDGQTKAMASTDSIPTTLGTLGLGEHNVHVKVTSKDGLSETATARAVVKTCAPVCEVVTVAPERIRLRNTVEVGARASVNPAYGGSQSIRQIVVTVNGPAGTQMSFDGATGSKSWKPEAIGDYTITAVATDSLGQQSAACTTANLRVDRPAVVPFGAAFVGKERLEQEYEDAGRLLATGVCSAIFGAKGGALFALGETGDFELAAGVKVNLEEGDRGEATSIFVDAAAQRLLGRGFIGGGLSAWDLTESDTRSIGALIQGGIDLDSKGKFQFTVEGRLPFNKLDDVDNNYQFWGGIRIRPAQR